MPAALLIIDTQHALFNGPRRPYEADAVLARINTLADRARAAGAPVIWILHEDAELVPESAAWQLDAALVTAPGDLVVRKTTCDAFLRTTLGEVLAARGIDRLVICGFATDYCVDTTTRRALALGYPVTLVADAHTTCDWEHLPAAQIREHHNRTLGSIESFGPRAEPVPTDAVRFAG